MSNFLTFVDREKDHSEFIGSFSYCVFVHSLGTKSTFNCG